MKRYSLFILLAAVVFFSSCSTLRIEKRKYTGGWYVDFGNNAKPQAGVDHPQEEITATEAVAAEQQEAAAVAPVFSEGDNCAQNPVAGTPGETIIIAPTNDEERAVTNSPAEQKQTPVAKHNKRTSVPSSEPADDMLILLVILAIFIPPLAVYLKEGVTPMFWITLILWLIGGAFLFGRFGYGYIGGLGLLAIVLALLVVFDKL
jgi:uncharacterized membrane protein YqaE (UPF0057 family)